MVRCFFRLLLLLFLLLPKTGFAEEAVAHPAVLELTLHRAIAIALKDDPGLRQSANQVAISSIDVAQRKTDFAPDLTATLTGAKHFDKTRDPLTGSRDDRDFETANGSLGTNLNLFNGFGDVAALRGAEWSLAGQQDTLTRDEQTLVYATATAFLQALSSRELIRVRTENLEGNRRQLEKVEALYRAGNRPISDLYQQQATVSSAELDLLTAERDDTAARLQLLQTIGFSPPGPLALRAPDWGPLERALVAEVPGNFVAEELQQRVDVQAKGKQAEAAREQVAVAQAGYWPTVNLSASLSSDYTSLQQGSGFGEQILDDNPAGAVSLTLTVPIFDRWRTRHQVAQARLRQDNARLALRQQQLQAEAEVGRVRQDFRTAQKQVGVTEAQLTAARQALAAIEERYRVGAATLVELTQARAQFTAAAAERVKARYGLITQGVAVAYYQGDGARMQALLAQGDEGQ